MMEVRMNGRACLWCWHPTGVPVDLSGAPFPTQLPDHLPEEGAGDRLSV